MLFQNPLLLSSPASSCSSHHISSFTAQRHLFIFSSSSELILWHSDLALCPWLDFFFFKFLFFYALMLIGLKELWHTWGKMAFELSIIGVLFTIKLALRFFFWVFAFDLHFSNRSLPFLPFQLPHCSSTVKLSLLHPRPLLSSALPSITSPLTLLYLRGICQEEASICSLRGILCPALCCSVPEVRQSHGGSMVMYCLARKWDINPEGGSAWFHFGCLYLSGILWVYICVALWHTRGGRKRNQCERQDGKRTKVQKKC